MDTEDIARRCASMSIADVNASVAKVEGKLKEASDKKIGLCLVGKVITNKQVNLEAFWLSYLFRECLGEPPLCKDANYPFG
ncbi:hypothetical protein ACOSQ2_031452 [Xanthoceras sorbifolium]